MALVLVLALVLILVPVLVPTSMLVLVLLIVAILLSALALGISEGNRKAEPDSEAVVACAVGRGFDSFAPEVGDDLLLPRRAMASPADDDDDTGEGGLLDRKRNSGFRGESFELRLPSFLATSGIGVDVADGSVGSAVGNAGKGPSLGCFEWTGAGGGVDGDGLDDKAVEGGAVCSCVVDAFAGGRSACFCVCDCWRWCW